ARVEARSFAQRAVFIERAVSSGAAGGSLQGAPGDIQRVHPLVRALSEKQNMKANILVVDDDRDIRGLLADILTSEQFKVAQAENAADAQKALAGEQPDIVILDVKLGQNKEDERAGLDLLPQIKKRWADTEVIMLTGQGTVEMAMEAGRRGAYNFLS